MGAGTLGHYAMIYVAAILVFGALLLLFTPIRFFILVRIPGAEHVEVRLWKTLVVFTWLEKQLTVSLLGHTLLKNDRSVSLPKKESREPETPPKTGSGPAAIIKTSARILRQPCLVKKWVRALSRSGKSMLRVVTFHNAAVSLCVGLDNPADTGTMMGAWYAISSAGSAYLPAKAHVEITPDFYYPGVAGTAEINGSTAVFRLMVPVIVFLWYAPLYRTYKMIYT